MSPNTVEMVDQLDREGTSVARNVSDLPRAALLDLANQDLLALFRWTVNNDQLGLFPVGSLHVDASPLLRLVAHVRATTVARLAHITDESLFENATQLLALFFVSGGIDNGRSEINHGLLTKEKKGRKC